MGVVLFLIAAALTIGGVIYGAKVLVEGRDPGLRDVEPDGRAVPLPADRPLTESDLERVRFDTALRGYRMDQVDAALARTAYDLGYKEELIGILQAEVEALWAGRVAEAEALRQARTAAQVPGSEADHAGEVGADMDGRGTGPATLPGSAAEPGPAAAATPGDGGASVRR
ncbi:MAG: DivIVA domain-containing protein [Micromonosporaceae bacterium]